ncbi:MAG: type IX secretion system membrane protein PorP/SprF [Cyclobacteriaceae bacterium]|nr:type IX secretion system membrane protein PorP/SprF [Cyclobacteriaceae bacterium]
MKLKRPIIQFVALWIAAMAGAGDVWAQYDGMYSQYMFNGFIVNPAYAGSQDVLNVTAMYKNQWAGVKEAPLSFVMSAHAPVGLSKVGVGILFANDQVGIHRTNSFSLAGSYALSIAENATLNFGLQGGIAARRSAYASLSQDLQDPNDQLFYQSDYSTTEPQIGAGLYLYTPRFYVGFSVPNISISRQDNIYEGNLVSKKRHYFVTAGYMFDLSSQVKLQPGLLIKAISGYGTYLDVNSTIIIMDALWLGASYRSVSSLNALIQMQVTNHLRLGYAYDAPLAKNKSVSTASHEILLSYYFTFDKRDVINPRYF